ncbi:putative UDP-glucose dehydrogenase Ugd1 [Aspergillus melleus]|uniref:putative UDP-glucose dehydrogenase Ugd1 n=1 Tax=Aspergillus melleus TaxID=138277 RepID=UPI001E8D4AF0|nr:uncharacterized protein LDX57_009713 [Aspergillus melleus]KAH8432065.1 hypothetical protein LDX57_009713 [Aspergillus melleus]
MMPFIPFLLVLAGLTIFFSRRKYKAIEQSYEDSPRVVVKGHTYSDSVEEIQLQPLPVTRPSKVEDVRCACVIGAGYVGTLTGLVLASQNPHVQFYIVDGDERLISAWNSDRVPISEPGVEELLFEDAEIVSPEARASLEPESEFGEFVSQLPRARKLHNVTFSTNLHAGITPSDMVFLCLETRVGTDIEDTTVDLTHLESALLAIAQVSTGHKIIVQKTTAPCGIVPRIKKVLKETASPSATFDVLSNPDFVVPGSALRDLLYPPRIVIGHIYSSDMSPEAITALKRLYTPFIPEDRILTMDAWSSELAKIAANAFLAQQISSLNSLSVLCESTNADMGHVTRVLGLSQRAGFGLGVLQADVMCLVYLARELGVPEVAEYWGSVVRMNGFRREWVVRRLTRRIGEGEEKCVAVLGVGSKGNLEDMNAGMGLVRELTATRVRVNVFDPHLEARRIEHGLGSAGARRELVAVADSVETACLGCHAVVVHTDWKEFSHESVRWQGIAHQMQQPKVFLDLRGAFDRFQMQQWGFNMLQLGVREMH